MSFSSPPGSVTVADGSYRFNLGCPESGSIGFNTTFLTAEHAAYQSQLQTVGRDIQSVQRIDFFLSPK